MESQPQSRINPENFRDTCTLLGTMVQSVHVARPPDKSVYLKIIFLISKPKHMKWALKRTASMRWFF